MTDNNTERTSGIKRRSILKGAAAAGAIGFVGLPAFTGSVAADSHVGTMTVVSDTQTMVTRRRAGTGENDLECSFTNLDVNAVPSWEHPAWEETTVCFSESNADWIWYSTADKKIPESGDYHVLNSVRGDVVEFERTFTVNGPPVAGSLTIAVDNGFEAYVNGEMVASRAVNDGTEVNWECSDLKDPYVGTVGWRTYGDCGSITFDVPTSALTQGENTLTVLAVNAHNREGAEELPDGNNPGGLIYELDVDYERCELCEDGSEMLAKYEWVEGDEEKMGHFMLEGAGDDYIALDKESVELDEDGEPVRVCFDVEYCDVDVIVKAGHNYEPYTDRSGEVCVTGIEAETPGGQTVTHAISNVRFYCDAPGDKSVGNSGGKGRGRGE